MGSLTFEARALNYTPKVKVGDKLVYRTVVIYSGDREVLYYQYNITTIMNSGNNTIIYADYNAAIYGEGKNESIAVLSDYTTSPENLLFSPILVPSTKIGD